MKSLIITSTTLSLFFNWHSQSKASPFLQESQEINTTETTQPTSGLYGDGLLSVSDDNWRTAQEWKEYFAQPSFTATAHDYKNAGIIFFHHGNFAYAAQCFQNFCALETNPPEMAYFATANILNKVDGYDGSIESFDPPFARTVSLPTQLYRKLGQHYSSNNFLDYKKALENYKTYFNQENQPIPEAFLEAAAPCTRLKNYTKGLFYIQKYIKTAQKINPDAYWYFAHFSYELDDYPTSISYYEKYFEHCDNPCIEGYFNYADSLIFIQNNTKAIELLKKYIKEKSKDTSSFQYDAHRLLSLAYLKNQDFKNAKTAFENYIDIHKNFNGELKEDQYIQAEKIYMGLGDYKTSSQYYKAHLLHFSPMSTLNLKNALLSFTLSHNRESANAVQRLLAQRNVFVLQKNKPLETPVSARKQNGSKRSKTTSRPLINENTVQELKKSISIQNYDNAKKIFDQVRKVQHPDLMYLQNEMQEVFEKCTQHFESVTQISSTPSTGPSSSRETPERSQQGDFLALQKLSSRMEELFKAWQKKKDIALRTAYNEEKKRIFLASATAPQELISIPLSMNIRAAFGYKKTSSAPATRNASSSASSSPATSSSSSNPLQVSWSFTHQANKQRTVLKTMPGFQTKLERFLDEIEEDPLLQTTTHGSGRAKKLVSTDNIFSRRFDKGNRFVYKVEKTTPDNVRLTVLSLLGHYKNLDLS